MKVCIARFFCVCVCLYMCVCEALTLVLSHIPIPQINQLSGSAWVHTDLYWKPTTMVKSEFITSEGMKAFLFTLCLPRLTSQLTASLSFTNPDDLLWINVCVALYQSYIALCIDFYFIFNIQYWSFVGPDSANCFFKWLIIELPFSPKWWWCCCEKRLFWWRVVI